MGSNLKQIFTMDSNLKRSSVFAWKWTKKIFYVIVGKPNKNVFRFAAIIRITTSNTDLIEFYTADTSCCVHEYSRL